MQRTLEKADALRMFHRCVWISFVPVLGFGMAFALITYESSLPPQATKPLVIIALAAIFGGDLLFCYWLGSLAQELGQSAARWRSGVWIASKFLYFVAWWLALIKIRFVLARAYAAPANPLFPR